MTTTCADCVLLISEAIAKDFEVVLKDKQK